MSNDADGAISHTGANLTIKPSTGQAGVQHNPAQLPNDGQINEPNPQGLANVAQLKGELEALREQERAILERGRRDGVKVSIPDSLRRQINAKSQSLAYEMNADRTVRNRATEQLEQTEESSLTAAYEADFTNQVDRAQRQHGISRDKAVDIVNQKLAAFGVDKVLPNYARVMRRLNK